MAFRPELMELYGGTWRGLYSGTWFGRPVVDQPIQVSFLDCINYGKEGIRVEAVVAVPGAVDGFGGSSCFYDLRLEQFQASAFHFEVMDSHTLGKGRLEIWGSLIGTRITGSLAVHDDAKGPVNGDFVVSYACEVFMGFCDPWPAAPGGVGDP